MGWTIWPCLVHRKEDEEKKNAAEIAMFERIFVGTGNEYQEERDRRLVEQESERNFDSVYPDWGSNQIGRAHV